MKYISAAVVAALMLFSTGGGVAAGSADRPAKSGAALESRSRTEAPKSPEALILGGGGGQGILDAVKGPPEQCGEKEEVCEETQKEGGGPLAYEDDPPQPGPAKKHP